MSPCPAGSPGAPQHRRGAGAALSSPAGLWHLGAVLRGLSTSRSRRWARHQAGSAVLPRFPPRLPAGEEFYLPGKAAAPAGTAFCVGLSSLPAAPVVQPEPALLPEPAGRKFGEKSCSGRALHQHTELSGFPRASRALPIPSESHPEGEREGFPVSPMCKTWQNGAGLGLREPWEGLATGHQPWVWEIGMCVPGTLLIRSGEAGVPFVLQGTRCKPCNAPKVE